MLWLQKGRINPATGIQEYWGHMGAEDEWYFFGSYIEAMGWAARRNLELAPLDQ